MQIAGFIPCQQWQSSVAWALRCYISAHRPLAGGRLIHDQELTFDEHSWCYAKTQSFTKNHVPMSAGM